MVKTAGTANSRAPGSTDYVLTAVVRFADAETQMFVKQLEENSVDKKIVNVEVGEWFPEAVKKAARRIDNQILIKGTRYSPDSFLRSHYSGGSVVRVGNTNYFVLQMFTT